MIYEEERLIRGDHEILLRSAVPGDAQTLMDFLPAVCRETRFLSSYADEVHLTEEQELKFIEDHRQAERDLLLLAFVDGEYAGNCSFKKKGISRRNAHRAGMGIALYQRFTGRELGRLMLERLLSRAKDCGYAQMELEVWSKNTRALGLYKSLGFIEYGRLPDAGRYDDGTFDDEIFMVKTL